MKGLIDTGAFWNRVLGPNILFNYNKEPTKIIQVIINN